MSKAMFQISGAADSGEIAGTLHSPNAETLSLALDTPVELEQSGNYLLELNVDGFPTVSIGLDVDVAKAPSVVKAKQLPLACRLVRQQSADVESGEQSAYLHLLRCNFAVPRELVIVAGADYADEKTQYDRQAESRRGFQTQEKYATIDPIADGSTIVTEFNFTDGWRRTYMLRSATKWLVVNEENFGVPACNAQSPDGLSITHVYDWLIQAGEAMAGRVVEFAIFAKSALRGPTLVNSDDESDGNERDPNDHDCRTKDFNGSNVDVAKLGTAFAEDAQCHIFTGKVNEIVKSCALVVAKPEPEDANRKYQIKRANGTTMKLTWKQCKMQLQKALRQHFAAHLADALGVNVWACSPGSEPRLHRLGKRHYWSVDEKKYGVYVDAVTEAFSLEKNDGGYVAYTRVMVESIDGESSEGSSEESAGDASTADSTAPAATTSLSITFPNAEHKQYVNVLDPSFGSEFGPKVTIEAQVDPPEAGVTIHWGFSGDYDQSLGELSRPGFTEARNNTASSSTDGSGRATTDFYLTPHGGNTFTVTASKTPGGNEATAPAITVWRKLWYEMEAMLGADGQPLVFPYFDLVAERVAEFFLELEIAGESNRLPYTGIIDGDAVIGMGADYFSAEKTPYQVQLVTVDRIQVEVEFAVSSILGALPARSNDQVALKNPNSSDWFVSGLIALHPTGSNTYQEFSAGVDYFELKESTTANGEHYIVVKDETLNNLRATGNYEVDSLIFQVQVRQVADLLGGTPAGGPYRFQCYVPMGVMNDLNSQGHDFEAHKIPPLVSGSIVHELCHVMGMVQSTLNNYVDTESGPHCVVPACIMHKGLNADSTGEFCDDCREALRTTDLSAYVNVLQAARGAKA